MLMLCTCDQGKRWWHYADNFVGNSRNTNVNILNYRSKNTTIQLIEIHFHIDQTATYAM